ncbi:hypothetical protein AABM38_18360 [Heyndrickxia sp. MSNUG]|uniref:hypothetical protein n=1 Tax=Heyndrickxia sp. MSNUG TaxID=3136677 RepID=UPI003C304BE0
MLNFYGQGLIDLISQNNGVAGINAGGFVDPGGNGCGGQPIGTVISDGVITNNPNANNKELMAAFLEDGQFITLNIINFGLLFLLKIGKNKVKSQ